MASRKGFALVVASLLSVILLLGFGALQEFDAAFLRLSPQWLLVALFPIVVALFVGGYVSRFKGFGVELEAAIGAPVATVNLTASELVADIPGDEKRSISYLNNLSREKARSLWWLLFTSGRVGYYTAFALEQYLERLPNLDFLEVRYENGGILGFLPIASIKGPDDEPDRDRLEAFISAVENGDLGSAFPGEATTLQVRTDESMVDVLRKMRSERAEFAAVVSQAGRYQGVVLARDLERRIADSVLVANRN